MKELFQILIIAAAIVLAVAIGSNLIGFLIVVGAVQVILAYRRYCY